MILQDMFAITEFIFPPTSSTSIIGFYIKMPDFPITGVRVNIPTILNASHWTYFLLAQHLGTIVLSFRGGNKPILGGSIKIVPTWAWREGLNPKLRQYSPWRNEWRIFWVSASRTALGLFKASSTFFDRIVSCFAFSSAENKRLVLHSDWLPNQMAQILPVFVSFDLTSFIIAFAICSFIGSQLHLSYPMLPS